MYRHPRASIALLGAAIAACLLATPVFAEPAATDAITTDAAKPDVDETGVTTGSVNVEDSAKKRMDDCMAIWEPRTHMSKAEWRRTCKSSLKEF
jgi:hypothetical protein